MKKKIMSALMLLLLITGAVSNSFAQTEKGKFSVGGSFNLDVTSPFELKPSYMTTVIEIDPSVGYFILNGLEVGVEAGILKRKRLDFKSDELNQTNINSLGVYGRKYFGSSTLKPFVGANLLFGNHKLKNTYGVYSKYNVKDINAQFGLAYFINEFVSIESLFNTGVHITSMKGYRDTLSSVSNLKIGFRLYF